MGVCAAWRVVKESQGQLLCGQGSQWGLDRPRGTGISHVISGGEDISMGILSWGQKAVEGAGLLRQFRRDHSCKAEQLSIQDQK